MRIDIKQHKISIGDGYDIFINGKRTFVAYTQILTSPVIINLAKAGTDDVVLSIESNYTFFRSGYLIKRKGKEYSFNTVSWSDGHHICQAGEAFYNIYGHPGNKYSVYNGKDQIACWAGLKVSFLEGDEYTIHADYDARPELLIAFCLIIDHLYHNGGSLINFNLGPGLGAEIKSFNENWKPKAISSVGKHKKNAGDTGSPDPGENDEINTEPQVEYKPHIYTCEQGELIVEQELFLPNFGEKVFLNGRPAPTGKYKIGFLQYVFVVNGFVSDRLPEKEPAAKKNNAINNVETKPAYKAVLYKCDQGELTIEQEYHLPNPGEKAYLNGKPAPTGKYKIGFFRSVTIENGMVSG